MHGRPRCTAGYQKMCCALSWVYHSGDYAAVGGCIATAFSQRSSVAPTALEATGKPVIRWQHQYNQACSFKDQRQSDYWLQLWV